MGTFTFRNIELRTVDIGGKAWFAAPDVCRILGLHNTTEATRALSADEVIVRQIEESRGRPPKCVSESGLYKIIMRSDKPQAKEFQEWVTRHVLPAIRKDGGYIMGEEKVSSGEMTEDELVLKAVGILQAKVERLSAENAYMSSELNLLTVDEYRALNHKYWSRGFAVVLGNAAAKLCREQGIKMGSQRRLFRRGKKIINTKLNVYPREVLMAAHTHLTKV